MQKACKRKLLPRDVAELRPNLKYDFEGVCILAICDATSPLLLGFEIQDNEVLPLTSKTMRNDRMTEWRNNGMTERMKDAKKSQQHLVFPSGLPSKYYPGPMLLNFSDQTRTGVFNMVWPLTRNFGKNVSFKRLAYSLQVKNPLNRLPFLQNHSTRHCQSYAQNCFQNGSKRIMQSHIKWDMWFEISKSKEMWRIP